MATLAPGSEALYLVAEDAMALNRPREAVDALVALGPDRGFTRGWWVYWSDLTSALHLVGDHRRELQAALEGLRRFPDNSQILATQVRALAALGRLEEMRRGVAATMNLPPMQGWAAADVLLLAAVELRAHGHPAAADTLLGQARDWLAARPPCGGSGSRRCWASGRSPWRCSERRSPRGTRTLMRCTPTSRSNRCATMPRSRSCCGRRSRSPPQSHDMAWVAALLC